MWFICISCTCTRICAISNNGGVLSQETDNSVRLKIASLLGLLSKTQGFSPDCIIDDAINTLSNESKSLCFFLLSLVSLFLLFSAVELNDN